MYLQPFSPADRVTADQAALAACFAPAIDLRVHQITTVADSGSTGSVTPSELRSQLAHFKARPEGNIAPWVHVFFAQGLDGRRPYGVMYDAIEGDSRVEREGCAVFTPRIDFRDPSGRLLARTLAHEIGHVLNLGHEDGEGASIMAAGLPGDFSLTFSANCLHHLANHPADFVLPGAGKRGFGQLCPPDSVRHPPRDGVDLIESSSELVSLTLEVWSSDRTWSARTAHLRFGEPFLGRTTIPNGRRRAVYVEASRRDDPRVWIEIRGADGGWRRQNRASRTCTFERFRVAPKQPVHQHHFLLHRRGRYIFPDVGTHAVRAAVALGGRRITSRPVDVTLRPPRHDAERAWLELALDPILARFLEGEGAESAVDARLDLLLKLSPRGHPLRDAAHLAMARQAAHTVTNRIRAPRLSAAMSALQGRGVEQEWVRSEIRIERARVLARGGHERQSKNLYLAVSRDEAGDCGTRRRAAEELEGTCG